MASAGIQKDFEKSSNGVEPVGLGITHGNFITQRSKEKNLSLIYAKLLSCEAIDQASETLNFKFHNSSDEGFWRSQGI